MVLLHVVALWALQTGLLRRAEVIVPPEPLLAGFVTRPASVVAAPLPVAQPPSPRPKFKSPAAPRAGAAARDPTPLLPDV